MGNYRNEDDALIGLARQLTDAYGEARRREDQDYACDSIAEFLSEYRDSAPDEALLAILDLPLTVETYPLVDETQTTLAGRGAGVVRVLLEAALGDVYDPDGEAPERAAETLGMMDLRERLVGLTAVLCGRADDDVKGAAVDALVAMGGFAEPPLAGVLDDTAGSHWAKAALEQIRYERANPGPLEEYAAGEGEAPDDSGELLRDVGRRRVSRDAPAPRNELPTEAPREIAPPFDAEGSASAGSPTPAGPDETAMDDAYDDSLRRFEDESGEETSPS